MQSLLPCFEKERASAPPRVGGEEEGEVLRNSSSDWLGSQQSICANSTLKCPLPVCVPGQHLMGSERPKA